VLVARAQYRGATARVHDPDAGEPPVVGSLDGGYGRRVTSSATRRRAAGP
jgi:hypothetical protein